MLILLITSKMHEKFTIFMLTKIVNYMKVINKI